MIRLLRALVLAAAGAATAVAAVAVHSRWWGLLLVTTAVTSVLVALPGRWSARLPFGLCFGLGVGVLSVWRPGGGYVVASDAPGYLLLLLALATGVAAIATVPRPGARRARGGVGPGLYTDAR